MKNAEIFARVDHTLLKACADWSEIDKLCKEAIEYKTASVCVPPSYVSRIHKAYADELNICTVIGFPLGYSSTASKLDELRHAIDDGAKELDMVINLGDVKNGDFSLITDEIAALKLEAGGNILKVIIETCYLTLREKIMLCHCVCKAKADYIKTSTGFGPSGANVEDVLLFKEHIGSNVLIKAAGGIRTKEDMIKYIEAGCARIGTSSAVNILVGSDENA